MRALPGGLVRLPFSFFVDHCAREEVPFCVIDLVLLFLFFS